MKRTFYNSQVFKYIIIKCLYNHIMMTSKFYVEIPTHSNPKFKEITKFSECFHVGVKCEILVNWR